jgi:hypothetical protein
MVAERLQRRGLGGCDAQALQWRAVVDAVEAALGDLAVGDDGQRLAAGIDRDVGERGDGDELTGQHLDVVGAVTVQQGERWHGSSFLERRRRGRPCETAASKEAAAVVVELRAGGCGRR